MTPSNLMTTNSSVEQKTVIANAFLSAMKQNEWQKMSELMMDAVTWTLPGNSILSGKTSGEASVIKRAQSLKKFGVMFELQHVLYGFTGFTLSLHNTASRDNLILDEYVAIVFELHGDKICSMATHLSDVDGINRFFVEGIIE